MEYIYFLLVFIYCLERSSVLCSSCHSYISSEKSTVEYECTKLQTLVNYLEKAKSNTSAIIVYDSNIPNIHGHAFARFGATLRILDLHESGIQSIDSQAFVALTNLQKLVLWGNKLTWMPVEWFLNVNYLQTLDVSFNSINYIDYRVFQILPHLENFYFDYNQLTSIDFNMFSYLTKLKKVRLGNNPWDWAIRTRLTWQLENQNVDIVEDFENWKWMSKVVKYCIESEHADLPSNSILDCAIRKLLDFSKEIFEGEFAAGRNNQSCSLQAQNLLKCARPENNTIHNDNETMRIILQDLTFALTPMKDPLGAFHLNRGHKLH